MSNGGAAIAPPAAVNARAKKLRRDVCHHLFLSSCICFYLGAKVLIYERSLCEKTSLDL
ncbi:MAG: hypothetical protein ACRC2S_24075 [Waterburya sp.]